MHLKTQLFNSATIFGEKFRKSIQLSSQMKSSCLLEYQVTPQTRIIFGSIDISIDAGGVGAGSFGLVPNLYILNFNGAIPPELLSIYKIMV